MLQTPEYASALMRTISEFQGTPDDAEAAAAARAERSRLFRRGPRTLVAIVEEAVLRYRVGSDEVMAAQLGYLLEVMAFPSVSFGVIPFGARRSMWPLEAFYMFDEERVSVETLSALLTITAPSEIAAYGKAFGRLLELAAIGSRARSLVTDAIAALG
jgi:hypothetical protein